MTESPRDASYEILRRSFVFQAAPSADLERLASRCRSKRYRRGEEIARRSTPGDDLVAIGRGRVKATIPAPDGEGEFLFAIFGPGELIGEIAVFDSHPRAVAAIAVTEAEVTFVPRLELLALLERRPAVALRMIESVCGKLRTAIEVSVSLRFLDVPSRLYQRLAYLSRFDSRYEGDGGGIRIHHGLSQQELADSIGTSRESLNKVIGEWRRAGLLEWGRGYVTIHDPAGLALRLPLAVRHEAILAQATFGPSGTGNEPVSTDSD